MTIPDVMTVFRQIIGVIARIDKIGPVRVEYIAQDMDVNIVDLRVWLKLMDALRLVDYHFLFESDLVVLKLPVLDALGFDTAKWEAE